MNFRWQAPKSRMAMTGRNLWHWIATLSCGAALTGCGASTPAPTAQPRPNPALGASEPDLNAERWLDEFSKSLKELGASQLLTVAVGAGTAGDHVESFVQSPEQECLALYARGTTGVLDIDLFVYGDDGTVFGVDEAGDNTPGLLICPPHPKRLYVVARVAGGHGIVAIGAQTVKSQDAEAVRSRLDSGPAAPQSAEAKWRVVEAKLLEHQRTLGGKWQELRRVALPVDQRIPATLTAIVEGHQCLDVFASPTEGVSHLDLVAKTLDGRVVGTAKEAGNNRTLLACARSATSLSLEIRPHIGQGLVAIVLSRTDGDSLAELDPRTPRIDLVHATTLADARAHHEARLKQLGYSSSKTSVRSGALQLGRRVSIPISLKAGCSRVDLLTAAPILGVEMWLWSDEGSLVGNMRGTSHGALYSCGPARKLRLDLESLGTSGEYSVEVRKGLEQHAVLSKHPLAASRLLGRLAAGTSAELPAAKLEVLELTIDTHKRLTLEVEQGQCLDLTVTLGPGGVGAELRLLKLPFDGNEDAGANELARTQGAHSATAKVCAAHDAPAQLEVQAEIRLTAGQATALLATQRSSAAPDFTQ